MVSPWSPHAKVLLVGYLYTSVEDLSLLFWSNVEPLPLFAASTTLLASTYTWMLPGCWLFTAEASQLESCVALTIASHYNIFSGHNCWPLSNCRDLYITFYLSTCFLWLVECVHGSPGTALRVLFLFSIGHLFSLGIRRKLSDVLKEVHYVQMLLLLDLDV